MARTIRYLLLLTTITSLALGQTLLPATASDGFPQCAYGCATLQNAASSCMASPDKTQSVVASCFCQSSLLTALHSSPNGVCDSSCGQSDLQSLETWYNTFCASDQSTSNTQPTTTAGTTLTASTTPASTAAATATSGTTSDSSSSSSSASQSWLHSHWRWVVMLIVLFVVFLLISFLALYLKKRNRRKNAANRAPTPVPFMEKPQTSQLSLGTSGAGTRTGTMQTLRSLGGTDGSRTRTGTMQSRRGDLREMWGPHQHMAATRGWEYTDQGVIERGDTIEPVMEGPGPGSRTTRGTPWSGGGSGSLTRSAIQEVDMSPAQEAAIAATRTADKHKGRKISNYGLGASSGQRERRRDRDGEGDGGGGGGGSLGKENMM